jgi:hypothetical protein
MITECMPKVGVTCAAWPPWVALYLFGMSGFIVQGFSSEHLQHEIAMCGRHLT